MGNHTAKHFVLQLGSLASLYLSLSFLLVLLFGLINIVFPDQVDAYWEIQTATEMVRIGFAMVIVFFPTYLILTRIVNKTRRKDAQGSYLGLTKWLIYLSLLIGGAVLLGDLVAVIMNLLDGELTQRFILKALAVLIVVGAAFTYYIYDARGYWIKNEKKSLMFGGIATAIVIISLAFGIGNVQPPAEVREARLDENQINDLQNIQWQIQDHLVLNDALPQSLDDLTNKNLPTAPEGRPDYTYELTDKGFKLCATFDQPSQEDKYHYARPVPVKEESPVITNPDNWEHEAGDVCFERVVK